MLKNVLLLCLAACATTAPSVPASSPTPPEVTLVWVGRGECERYENGAWVRRPEFDYDFSVEQKRFGEHWESVKSMRRRHPDYDGSAGERALTYFFNLGFSPATANGAVDVTLNATIGNGMGQTDREFRRAVLNFKANVSAMAPFDRYRISQTYDYEAGRLTELVELNKGESPWVRNHEVATLFAPHQYTTPPTTR